MTVVVQAIRAHNLSKVCVIELIVVFPEVLSKVSNPLYMLRCPGRSYPARYTATLATSRDCSHITWSRNPASVPLLATFFWRFWFDCESSKKFCYLFLTIFSIISFRKFVSETFLIALYVSIIFNRWRISFRIFLSSFQSEDRIDLHI
jgi:hypothetical protein